MRSGRGGLSPIHPGSVIYVPPSFGVLRLFGPPFVQSSFARHSSIWYYSSICSHFMRSLILLSSFIRCTWGCTAVSSKAVWGGRERQMSNVLNLFNSNHGIRAEVCPLLSLRGPPFLSVRMSVRMSDAVVERGDGGGGGIGWQQSTCLISCLNSIPHWAHAASLLNC